MWADRMKLRITTDQLTRSEICKGQLCAHTWKLSGVCKPQSELVLKDETNISPSTLGTAESH